MSYKTEFKTGPMEGRLAWCYLGQPRTVDMDNKPKVQPSYECSFYFPKTHADPRQCRNYAFFAQHALDVVQNAYRGQWPMMDGGYVTIPEDAMYTPDRQWSVENYGVEPDVEIENEPADLLAGHDAQLEAAVELLLKAIAGRPAGFPAPPPLLPPP